MDREAWVDGAFVDATAGAITVVDRIATNGVGLFETMGAVDGRLPLWNLHLDRLTRSASVFGLEFIADRGLDAAARELLIRNGRENGILRLTIGSGNGRALRRFLTTRPRVERFTPLTLAVSNCRRGASDKTAEHKTTSRAFYKLAQRDVVPEMRDADFDDVLILGENDDVLETTVGNVVLLYDDRLCTPELDGRILPGIARRTILEGLRAKQFRIDEREIHVSEAVDAHAIWVTNAVYGPRRAVLLGAASGTSQEAAVEGYERELVAGWVRAGMR